MDFPIFLNKLIIGNKYLRHTSFWYWFRLTNHSNWRMDDHQRYWDFWYSINSGWCDMEYDWEFEKFWGKGAKAEQIVLHREDYDAIVEMLNEPPNAAIMERLKELMNRKAPWDE
jgi:hypothetical protein